MISTDSTYRSRVDARFYMPWVGFGLLVLLVAFFSGHWYVIPVVGGPVGSVLAIYFNTSYTIAGNEKLQISCSTINDRKKVIDILNILKINHTKNSVKAPALSRERLEIIYNQNERIYLSPRQEQRFIKELMTANPGILLNTNFL